MIRLAQRMSVRGLPNMKLTLKSVRAAGFALDSVRWEQFQDRLKILLKSTVKNALSAALVLRSVPLRQ